MYSTDSFNQGRHHMSLTMSSNPKRLILFLLSSVFYTPLPSSISSFSCSSLSFPPFCSSYSPLLPCSPLDIFNYEIPSINVNLDSLIDEFSGAPCRRSLAVTDSPEGDAVPEEEPQSTTLWPKTLRHHSLPAPLWLYILLTVATKAWWKHQLASPMPTWNQNLNPSSYLLQAAKKLLSYNCSLVHKCDYKKKKKHQMP